MCLTNHSYTCHHMSERLLFPCSLFSLLPLSLVPLRSPSLLPVLCSKLQLPRCRERRALNPKRTRQLRSIALWRYTTLSHFSSHSSRLASPTCLHLSCFFFQVMWPRKNFMERMSVCASMKWFVSDVCLFTCFSRKRDHFCFCYVHIDHAFLCKSIGYETNHALKCSNTCCSCSNTCCSLDGDRWHAEQTSF